MKTLGRASLAALLVLSAFLLLLVALPAPVAADAYGEDFEISFYAVKMKVGKDRTVQTTESLYVRFFAPRHGIVRDFDLTGGTRYRAIEATRDGLPLSVSAETEEENLLALYLGSEHDPYLSPSRTYVYEISYVMVLPETGEEGYLPLDVIGYDWQASILEATVQVQLPEAPEAHEVFSGRVGGKENAYGAEASLDGDTVLISVSGLGARTGVTLDLRFKEGVLQAPPADLTPLWALALAGVAVAAFLLLKALFCRQPLLTRTVSFSAPEGMDPLRMGKIIDNKIDPEDMGALIYWLAAEGYLTLDLSGDKENPLIVKTEKPFPSSAPEHLRIFYEGLFYMREQVRADELETRFYPTAEKVKRAVNGETGFYTAAGKICIGVLAALCILLFGLFGFLYSLATVRAGYRFIMLFIACAASFGVAAFGSLVARQRMFKWKRSTLFFTRWGAFLLACLAGAAAWLFYSVAFTPFTSMILIDAAALVGCLSGYCLVRTADYSKRLGFILGFKDFIVFTERDKIEKMLGEQPELYYRVLPYAQVLGVTDAWAEKFEGLSVEPPAWATLDAADLVLSAMAWNLMFRSVAAHMAHSFVSRPSNRGGGFHTGGFGGGFGGGGFGGGGGHSF